MSSLSESLICCLVCKRGSFFSKLLKTSMAWHTHVFCCKSLIFNRMCHCHSRDCSKMSRLATSSRHKKQNAEGTSHSKNTNHCENRAGFQLEVETAVQEFLPAPAPPKHIHPAHITHELINIPMSRKEIEKSHLQSLRLWLIFLLRAQTILTAKELPAMDAMAYHPPLNVAVCGVHARSGDGNCPEE